MLAWNIRGLNKKNVVTHIKNFQVSCVALLKTRVKHNNANRIRMRFWNGWSWLDNYTHHLNGRIWIM